MITDKELLEIVGGSTPTNQLKDDKSNIVRFIREFKIGHGSVPVPNYLIYYHYSFKWEPTGKKLSKITFFKKFKKEFSRKRTKYGVDYMINEGVFDLSIGARDEARKYDKEQERKKRYQKK